MLRASAFHRTPLLNTSSTQAPFSTVPQLHSYEDFEIEPSEIFDLIVVSSGEHMTAENANDRKMIKAATADENSTLVWIKHIRGTVYDTTRFIEYRTIPLPWPLSPRDILYHGHYIRDEEGDVVASYVGNFKHPALADERPGYVRAQIFYQYAFAHRRVVLSHERH